MEQDIIDRAIEYEEAQRSSIGRRSNPKIGVYLHNVASGPTWEEGYVSPLLQHQFSILHDVFRPHGFELSLRKISHTINPDWANSTIDSQAEADMKNALHQGTYTDVNNYILDRLFDHAPINDTIDHIDLGNDLGFAVYELGGLAHFPLAEVTQSSDYTSDGISLNHKVAWGAFNFTNNLGLVAVHEMGHWLGLPHPFSQGCEGLGDGIADTPNDDIGVPLPGNATFMDCLPRDTCPDKQGTDPIHNDMGYTWDSCRTEFTPGQVERMHSLFNLLRLPKVPA
ncbi:uncharacterized protein RAG0_05957 [Rhynchosporium agropyri]|uniref:Peptidase M43 pregnancy-associated plasma-A domain-containing protein n=1 Tax=Rhynchosporium agropyri TaxID=914238 RepID=A0A1E1KFK3_9HELO|nr:uncharacterized protein RAG0_05957 [Rhynchosporium agropyri]